MNEPLGPLGKVLIIRGFYFSNMRYGIRTGVRLGRYVENDKFPWGLDTGILTTGRKIGYNGVWTLEYSVLDRE
jgi:hypothetical protein